MRRIPYYILIFMILFSFSACQSVIDAGSELMFLGSNFTPEQRAELKIARDNFYKAESLVNRGPLPPLYKDAYPYYEKSATLGNEDGIIKIYEILTNEFLAKDYGTIVQPLKAEQYLKKGQEYGYSECVYRLGQFYSKNGNTDEAIKFYKQAISIGCIKSYFYLGMIYENTKDYANARAVYDDSSHKFNKNAGCLYRYARLMELGLGGPQSEKQAIILFDMYWYENGNNGISYTPPREDWTPIYASMPKEGITHRSKTFFSTECPRFKWSGRALNNAIN